MRSFGRRWSIPCRKPRNFTRTPRFARAAPTPRPRRLIARFGFGCSVAGWTLPPKKANNERARRSGGERRVEARGNSFAGILNDPYSEAGSSDRTPVLHRRRRGCCARRALHLHDHGCVLLKARVGEPPSRPLLSECSSTSLQPAEFMQADASALRQGLEKALDQRERRVNGTR